MISVGFVLFCFVQCWFFKYYFKVLDFHQVQVQGNFCSLLLCHGNGLDVQPSSGRKSVDIEFSLMVGSGAYLRLLLVMF